MCVRLRFQMWRNYNDDPADADKNQTIMVMFSIFTGCGNVISPIVADMLHKRGIIKRAHYCAIILLVESIVFGGLGVLSSVPSLRRDDGAQVLYMILMASVGIGFGTFLATYPAILADNFGFRNFGCVAGFGRELWLAPPHAAVPYPCRSYMSFLQFGTAVVAILAPVVAAWVVGATDKYSPMHWGFCGLLFVAAVLMAVVPSTTQTFTPARPKRSASYHDDEDAFAGYGAVDDGGSDGSGGDTGARAGGRRDEISLPRKSPGPRRLPAPRLSDDEGV